MYRLPVEAIVRHESQAVRMTILSKMVDVLLANLANDGGSYCTPEPFSCPEGADHECCLLCYAYYLLALNFYAAEDPPNETGCHAALLAWLACKAQCPRGGPKDGGCGCGKA